MERNFKGHSLIELPYDFTIIDIETTGLSPDWDDIIEVSALKCRNWNIKEEFSSLIKPSYPVSNFITELTGISNEMLESQPTKHEILPKFINFLGDDIIVAHNANFDINFLYDSSIKITNTPISNDYIDTMRISRILNKDEKHHRLIDLCCRYGIENKIEHRALSDCYATFNCFLHLRDELYNKWGSVENLKSSLSLKRKQKASLYQLHAKDITPDILQIDESNMLYNKTCVFTGKLEKMTRRQAMQIVVNIGGLIADGVTKETNFLIMGNNDYCSSIKDGKSNKQKKAEKLKLEGYDIEIIPESVFYEIVLSD